MVFEVLVPVFWRKKHFLLSSVLSFFLCLLSLVIANVTFGFLFGLVGVFFTCMFLLGLFYFDPKNCCYFVDYLVYNIKKFSFLSGSFMGVFFAYFIVFSLLIKHNLLIEFTVVHAWVLFLLVFLFSLVSEGVGLFIFLFAAAQQGYFFAFSPSYQLFFQTLFFLGCLSLAFVAGSDLVFKNHKFFFVAVFISCLLINFYLALLFVVFFFLFSKQGFYQFLLLFFGMILFIITNFLFTF